MTETEGEQGHRFAAALGLARLPDDADEGTLAERTIKLIAAFAAEEKGYGFDDGGDGTIYATRMADLLDEWLAYWKDVHASR